MDTLIPIAAEIGERLKARGETVAISESSAGGLISAALLAVPGASAFYRGGAVVYTPAAFKGLMRLTREDLQGHRSATEPYALILARTARERMRSDWGLCETGASGPDGNGYGDAAGHVCCGLVGEGSERSVTLETALTNRVENMHLFAREALMLLRDTLD
ncbi:MAG: CinA family protein [Pseudomonadota bacterium]